MPGIIQRGRKRPSIAVSEDEEHSDSSQASTESKRARYTDNASDRSRNGVSTISYRLPSGVPNGHDADEDYAEEVHQPGSIVRVKLTNFVTYTEAEFHPGPSLNMVIGPNGTGKSTLVCAICLGLGWDTKNLGRAKDVGEFVKHGSSEALIEIELAAAQHHPTNPIIRRKILKQNNKSAFSIDGRSATQKEVVKLARNDFSIQIDNLCQFLPQDRVVEFAGLQPVDLLRETLRAAAPERMVQWHQDLINLRSQEKGLETEHRNEESHLKGLQAKQSATRHDVERWNERQKYVMQSRVLEKCRPIIESRLIKKEREKVKADRQIAVQELRQLLAEVEPTRIAQQEMETYRAQVEEIKTQRRSHLDKARQRADKLNIDITSAQDSINEFTNQITSERDGERQRRQDTKRLESQIAEYERQMQYEPVEVDEEGYKSQRIELRGKTSGSRNRVTEIRTEMETMGHEVKRLRDSIQRAKNDRAALDTQMGQQASLLQRVSKDTAIGWDWIQKNRDSLHLRGEVYGPPILTCSVADSRFADIVEGQFGGPSDAIAITCTNSQDARLISDKLLGNEMRLHQVAIRTIPQPLAFYRSPVTRDELRGYGFDGWILDYIQGPEPVLAMLCDSAQLHRSAYTPNQLSEDQYKAIERSPISTWIAGRDKFRITRRREYGEASTRVNALTTAKYFAAQPVNAEDKQRLDDDIKRYEREILDFKEKHAVCKAEQQKYQQAHDEAEYQIKAIDEEYKSKRKARLDWENLPNKRAERQGELDDLRERMRETGRRILDINVESEKTALKIASLAIDYTKAVSLLRQVHENLIEAEIRLIEANSEVETLKAENAHITQALDAKKNVVRDLDEQKKSLAAQHNIIVKKAQQDIDQLSDEEKAIMEELSQLQTIDELSNEMTMVHAKLDMMADGDPNAVKAYENREREMETAQEKLEKITHDLQIAKEQIKEIRDNWEPELDELVAKISDGFAHNLSQIGCAGQVGVYKDEDFENWSIQIQVRFRENESLSILTSQRQSGGERAVSTIFYLMALQDFARAPFRVVDEINQGMDPRNERKVHERMVDIACRERTSQYFLVTPKLLNDLKYHPKMKVHCINSGEGLPSSKDLNWANLADMALRIKTRT